MTDFSQLLIEKSDTIVDHWVEAVRQDREIESALEVSYKGLRDSIPRVLKALATVLSQSQDNDVKSLVEASLEHGVVRAEQGYEPTEIAREYSLLRWVIFSSLEAELLKASPAEIMKAVRIIDAVVDEAIARCFKSYTEARLNELKQLQSQLRLTNQELTRLVRASKDNFFHLAHELKTPLAAIIGYSDLFLRQQRNNAEVKAAFHNLEHIEKVLRSGRQLLHLINDALEISRYEEGKMKLQLARTDVRTLIDNTLEMVLPLASVKNLQMIADCDQAPTEILTDPLRLQQIVTNLLSNAIRYTEVGSIKLICSCLPNNRWAITVSDTGIGIEPEDQVRIFEPYFQVAVNSTHLPNSTGLGLAIVSRLVNLLQGKVELASQVGIGSTFTIILPLEVRTSQEAATV